MKLLLDDKQHRGCNLNANEACIFAAILKCTRAGRGWYGNYRELAAAMPFVINHTTVYRAIQKLLNLGLIERREEKLFALLQNETELLHSATELLQNETELLQNALPPNTPPINNNMNEKEKEQQRALCARDCEKQQSSTFEDFKKSFIEVSDITRQGGENWFKYRGEACEQRWAKLSELQRRAIIADLKRCRDMHEKPFKENPYFYLCDFPEPQPTFLSGQEQDRLREQGIPLVQVKYNGKFLICTRDTMTLFGLEFVRDW